MVVKCIVYMHITAAPKAYWFTCLHFVLQNNLASGWFCHLGLPQA